MFVNTQAHSIHTDHLGTPKQITNQHKEVVWQIDLDTFGETKQIQAKTITDPNTNTQRPFEFNLRFAGQYFDQESGYHYNYHRYYDPSLGRYLTSDPIGLAGGLNTYGYANSEPWGAVDWLGLDAILITFPQYKAGGIPLTGHAGVVTIDDKTGKTRYYEYGRYDTNQGEVYRRSIPDLVMEQGKPTLSSMKNLLNYLSINYGKNSYVAGEYHRFSDNITAMHSYADNLISKRTDPNRDSYGKYYNNCYSFAAEVVNRGYGKIIGGIRTGGSKLDPTPDWPLVFSGDDLIYYPKSDLLLGSMYF